MNDTHRPDPGLLNLLAAFVPPPGTAAYNLIAMRAAGLDPRTELFGTAPAAAPAPAPRRPTPAMRRFAVVADLTRRPEAVAMANGAPRIVPTAPAPAPATDAQLRYLVSLVAGRDDATVQDATDAAYAGKDATSAMIDRLRDMPALSSGPAAVGPSVAVPAGRYAVDANDGTVAFYTVDHGTGRWAGRTFVRLNVGPSDRNLAPAAAATILARIAVDPKGAMLRYGREIGRCGHCGRRLTNDDSPRRRHRPGLRLGHGLGRLTTRP